MSLDVISYLLAKKALASGVRLPTLKDLVIDTDKDWRGHRIMNLGEPINPNDAARKIYVDVATTGLGINYYLLDEADTEVPAYKQMSIAPPELSEAYVETSQNGAGDYEIGAWIAPAGSIPVLRLGVYTLHFQAERISGNIGVRFFFRLYERDSEGNETLIAESSLSDLVADRRDVVVSLVLPHDYELSEGSRLIVKVYARYLSGGSSTTMRLYYQGDVRSRLATPIAKEVLDNIYASITHASRHALGGPDELSLDASQITSGVLSVNRIPDLDASKITAGVFDLARIPDLPRTKITDLFGSPFWDNIPDKPFDTLGSEFSVSAGQLQIAGVDASKIVSGVLSVDRIPDLDASKITSGVLDLARIPNIDWSRISGNFPRDISDLISSAFSRSWISDLFSSPFWDNIPDKPFETLGSEFAVSSGELQIAGIDASKIVSGIFDLARVPNLPRSKITDLFNSPFWDNIPDKPFETLGSEFTVSSGQLQIAGIDASKITSGILDLARIPSLPRSKITDLFDAPFWDSIPDKPFETLGSEFTVSADELQIAGIDASKIISGVLDLARIPSLPRSKISDLFSSPFWDNIPDKPSEFPPEAHTHGISDLTDFVNVTKVIIDTSANRPTAGVAGRLFFETDTHTIYYDNGSEWVKLGVADWDNIDGKPSVFPPDLHASAHSKGGVDELSLDASQITSGTLDAARIPGLDASKIVSGVLDVARIPDLSRSKITDLFSSPFWDNIPDKPFDTLGSEFSVSAGELQIAGIDASKITSGVLDVARIPDLDASKIVSGRFSLSRLPTSSTANRFLVVRTANADPVFDVLKASDIPNLDASKITSGVFDPARIPNLDASKITSGVFDVARIPDLSRGKITDFFSAPFWDYIPDKPFDTLGSEFTVSDGTLEIAGIDASKITSGVLDVDRIPDLSRGKITDLFDEPFWDNIPDKPFESLGSEFSVSNGTLEIAGIDASKIISGVLDLARIPSLPRSKISDLFDEPFWDYIPDKPFETLGSEFTVSSGELQIAGIDASKIVSGVLDLDRIPNIDWSRIADNFPRSISDLISSPFSRSWISDFFGSPFWDNIPDKPFETLGSEFNVSNGELQIGSIDFSKIVNRLSSLMTFDSSLVPNADNAYDLGSNSKWWRDGYIRGLGIYDNRDVTPSVGDYSREVSLEFKSGSAIGLSGTYYGLISIAPWSDDSGGGNHQLAFGYGEIWYRYGTRSSGWGSWRQLFPVLDIDSLKIGETEVIDSSRVLKNIASVAESLLPSADDTYDLGSSSLRWRNLYVVNAYTGDVIFHNDWVITEYDENGHLMDGLRILNDKGEEVLRITEDGLYFKGQKLA